ncbi:hypothetical protein DFH06DRAFT_1463921, partial [Mycena polygramma]
MAPSKDSAEYENRAGPALTIWDNWQPACDACGRLESSLGKQQLLTCAGCLLSKYCSKECQKQQWKSIHKHRCHLFEADRKLSTVFAKSLGPGTINDPKLSLADKVIQWNFLNAQNHLMIACAALKNSRQMAAMANVGILLRLVQERTGSKYDNRTFVIERVVLFPRQDSDDFAERAVWKYGNTDVQDNPLDHCKIIAGFCVLPDGEEADTQMWVIPTAPDNPCMDDTVLPPHFDLHQYITHVNRGVTHFHASFYDLPRGISDEELKCAEPPTAYANYTWDHILALSGLKGQHVMGIEREDGTRTPFVKRGLNGHIRACAPGETDSDGPCLG